MAGEIIVGLTLQFRGEQLISQPNVSIDQITLGRAGGIMAVTTGGITLDVGAVGTLGILMLRNLDSTNYVRWGPDNAGSMVPCGRLLAAAQEPTIFRLEPGITFRLQANGATCKVQYELLEA